MYDAEFEDGMMHAVTSDNQQHPGIRVIDDKSNETPIQGVSVHAADIKENSLPVVREEELPLALTDPRRTFASAIPNVKLTHPQGDFEGGAEQPDEDQDALIEELLANNPDINTPEQLQQAIDYEIGVSTTLLKNRMHARLKAKQKNEMLEKEIKTLVMTHDTELRVQKRMLDEQQARKDAKARKKQERAAE